MAIAKVEYGGYEIWVYDVFKAMKVKIVLDGSDVKSDLASIEDATTWIDKHNKKTFKKVAIIQLVEKGGSWREDFREASWEIESGEATSMIDGDVWTSFDGRRRKEDIKSVVIDTQSNRNAMLEIIELKKQNLKNNIKVMEIRNSLQTINPEMMELK